MYAIQINATASNVRRSVPLVFLISATVFSQVSNAQSVGTARIEGGVPVIDGEFQAVGNTSVGCSATLIRPDLVLTAAHCVCDNGGNPPTICNAQDSFTLRRVFPVDNPSTSENESLTREDVTISGAVRVHPNYAMNGFASDDFAVIELVSSVSEYAIGVNPIPVEIPSNQPELGDTATLVGYGTTGEDCAGPFAKHKIALPLNTIRAGNVTLQYGTPTSGACGGDSGGPAINEVGNVVGVASTGDPGADYDPTSAAYSWIFDTERLKQVQNRVSMLRVQEVGTTFGPPTDNIDAEVIFRLADHPNVAYGFQLRPDSNSATHFGMLDTLRTAFNDNSLVSIHFRNVGPSKRKVYRLFTLQ